MDQPVPAYDTNWRLGYWSLNLMDQSDWELESLDYEETSLFSLLNLTKGFFDFSDKCEYLHWGLYHCADSNNCNHYGYPYCTCEPFCNNKGWEYCCESKDFNDGWGCPKPYKNEKIDEWAKAIKRG
jgi:hypothetical protein